jgi:hypothetical protein
MASSEKRYSWNRFHELAIARHASTGRAFTRPTRRAKGRRAGGLDQNDLALPVTPFLSITAITTWINLIRGRGEIVRNAACRIVAGRLRLPRRQTGIIATESKGVRRQLGT